MPFEIKMPQLSDTMHSGKILAWRKKIGDNISRGDILAEVETDKANLEIECFNNGTLLQINTPEGSVANVGDIIAVVGQAGESVSPKSSAPTAVTIPMAETSQPNLQVLQGQVKTSQSNNVSYESDDNSRLKVSPLARKIAEQRNIPLSELKGTGPQGRIVKRDVDLAQTQTNVAPTFITPAPIVSSSKTPLAEQVANKPSPVPSTGRLTPLSKMRETIARRMQESVTQAPHFYVSASINMGQAIRLRTVLKEKPEYEGLSFNHMVIKAVAYGVANEPRVNNSVRDNQLYEPGQINIGIITAVNDGLLIPVIKEANLLSLKDIVFEAKAAVERARAGRPNASDLTGGTFSISNMGMFDVENFTAIINPGQGSILAVGAIKDQAIVQDKTLVAGQIMKVTISVDHRIIDGAMAGNFLKHFKEALEVPALMLA
jgi:pyruvate dehydrogenase E2 component (dihydrolipoamide acetyltransferase)